MTELRHVIDAMFRDASWAPWRAVGAAMFALPPAPGERELFEQCTGRSRWPTEPSQRVFLVCGRRAGKSTFVARIGVMLAAFRDYRDVLTAGETGVGMIIAADRRQGRVVKGYCSALCDALPGPQPNVRGQRVANETKESIELTNGITIEVHTRSFRAVRGYTVIFGICEELAFWDTGDAANPDAEVIAALEPAMATVPGSLLLAISSPYRRAGELWRAYQQHYGKDGGDTLVWQAASKVMNPLLSQAVIDRAYEQDEAAASAEYGAQFRRDIETFIAREALMACVVPGRRELPPMVAA